MTKTHKPGVLIFKDCNQIQTDNEGKSILLIAQESINTFMILSLLFLLQLKNSHSLQEIPPRTYLVWLRELGGF